jgi:anaerobic magnesium-protoporphyrin IX monomethyl ester cyclase
MDIVFINPSNAANLYQDLSDKLTAIEPPTWALLLAESVRSQGFSTAIIDANAEKLTDEEVLNRLLDLNPRLISFVVYGQNVNAGTAGMAGATRTSKFIKNKWPDAVISFFGSYIQALPKKALVDEKSIDFAFTNEGVYALWNILKLQYINNDSIRKIKGIVWRDGDNVVINPTEEVVPTERMDIDLPGYAWDLLPYKEKPLDLYRAPMWHGEYTEEKRSPYAAIQTSLGCMFACSFCMINIINRNDEEELGVAGNYSKMRFWSPEFIIKEFDKLASLDVRTIRIVDEMFLLNRKYYVPLCELLASRAYAKELRMWAYSRVDTIKNPEFLKLVRSAGIKWLCLGIESAERKVRLEISKGKFEDVDIKKVIQYVHEADIEVMANYIVGLPGENKDLMVKTLNLSLELCTSGWNMYAAMALPGSALYKQAIQNNYKMPESYEGFSFHSYETIPMPTEYLSAAEVLAFRDEAFTTYHSDSNFLKRIKEKFGENAVKNITDMTKIKLKRKIIEDFKSNL